MLKRNTPLALFIFLFSLYLLTYSPTLHSSDGLAMFSTAESLARRGAWDIEQIRWMGLQQGTYGLDDLLYSRKGAGQPLLALPLIWLGLVVPFLGSVTATMLFGSFTTALSGALIYLYLKKLGYREKTGVIAGLVYGTGTTAWPYAKTFFSDTLAGLLLLITALSLLTYRQKGQNRYAFPAGLSLAWAVATRYAEAVFLPVFGLLFLAYLFETRRGGNKGTRRQGREAVSSPDKETKELLLKASPCLPLSPAPPLPLSLSSFAAPILIIGIALLTFNTLRYGSPLNTGYLPQETFSAVWWQGILGQLISPGRGLLLYSPVLLLTFFGLKSFWQRHRPEFLASLAVIMIHLLLYGKWFMWHGGFAWGPRFLVATLPFWVILMAPVVQRATSGVRWQDDEGRRTKDELRTTNYERQVTNDRGQIRRSLFTVHYSLFIILWGLSIFLQLPGLAVDFDLWQNRLLETGLPLFDPITFFNPLYSPLLGTWQFINLANLDVVWAAEGKIVWWLLGVLVLNVAVAGWRLMGSERRSAVGGHSSFVTLRGHSSLALSILSAILLLTYAHQSQPADLAQAVAAVNRLPDTPLIYRDPLKAIPFAELYKGRAPVLGLREAEIERLDSFTASATSIWWLPTYQDEVESYLKASYGLAREETFGQQRLLLFARANGETQQIAVTFAEQITLQFYRLSPVLQANHPLAIELTWQAEQVPSADYHVFIHLLNADGEAIAQSDAQPVHWARPTSTWQPGETIIDRHALWVENIAPGRYTLIAGLYSPESGERLLTAKGNDYVELGGFEVLGK